MKNNLIFILLDQKPQHWLVQNHCVLGSIKYIYLLEFMIKVDISIVWSWKYMTPFTIDIV